nr:hypothetical protein [Tanacetum cinerariifolium]
FISFNVINMISFVFVALSAYVVSAQDFGSAPVGAPSGMESGFGYSVPVSGLVACVSLIVSMVVIMKH